MEVGTYKKNLIRLLQTNDLVKTYNFTLSIPRLIMQLLKFETTNAHNFIKITIILQQTH